MDFQRILVPVDFSDCSSKALDYAIRFGELYGSVLTLFHVITLFQEDVDELEKVQELEAYVKKQEQKIHQEIEKQFHRVSDRGVEVRSEVQRGISAADAILAYLEEQPFDLVIMGTHGRSGLKHLIQGSVAEKVVRLSPVPVLTIHRDVSKIEFDHILVPIDFSLHSRRAVEYGGSLAKHFNAHLIFLHVIEQEIHPSFYAAGISSIFEIDKTLKERVVENMREFVSDLVSDGLTMDYVVSEGKAHKEIVDYARHHSVDLIVIATHGLTGLEYLLLGSTTEKVVRWAACPVLTVKRQSK